RICRKILLLEPNHERGKKEIKKYFKIKYSDHSKYSEFYRLAGFDNPNKDINEIVEDFEKHISFDIGNFVIHRNWGIGKISDFIGDRIKIDFEGKPDHLMSLSMAMTALSPVPLSHFNVQLKTGKEELEKLRDTNHLKVIEIILSSFGGEMALKDIKEKMINDLVEENNWTKWWNKALKEIKKSSRFGKSKEKANTYFMRSDETSFEAEQYKDFSENETFNEKIEILKEFMSHYKNNENYNTILGKMMEYFTNSYTETVFKKLKVNTRQDIEEYAERIQCHFIIKEIKEKTDAIILPAELDLVKYTSKQSNLHEIVFKIDDFNYKKDFLTLIKNKEDWAHEFSKALVGKPIRLQNYIFNELVKNKKYTEI
ncbi:MAG: hypothetical protein KAS39_04045, partial [Actinomycetia bacterium]|nr:hypothetical protein [Actinomycetes bacterium]